MKLPLACRKENNKILCEIDGNNIEMKSCRWYLGNGAMCNDFSDNSHLFQDTIFPPHVNKENRIEETSFGTIWEDLKKLNVYKKDLYFSGHLGDIGETGDKLQIKSYFANIVVREIEVKEDTVLIKAREDVPLELPKNTSVLYEPWFMDRGSFVFLNPPGNEFPLRADT